MIEGIEHIGIAVRSIAEGRLFYEALGFKISGIEDVPEEGVRVAMIPCGDSRIELIESMTADSPIARFIARRGPGLHHLCLSTGSIGDDDQRLRDAGFRLLRAEPSRGAGGCWVQFVHPESAGGVLVELAQCDDVGEEGEP